MEEFWSLPSVDVPDKSFHVAFYHEFFSSDDMGDAEEVVVNCPAEF